MPARPAGPKMGDQSYFADRLHHGGGTRKGSTRANTKAAEDTEMYQGHEGKPGMLGS